MSRFYGTVSLLRTENIGREATYSTSTPTRVCLAGEDLDWMGGKSVCTAIDLHTSVQVDAVKTATSFDLVLAESVWRALAQRKIVPGLPMPAFPRMVSEAPMASGLSTSTSATISYMKYFLNMFHTNISTLELMQLSYELEFDKISGGGMDQVSILMGGTTYTDGRDGLLPRIIDCIDFPEEWQIVVIDSGVRKDTGKHISSLRKRRAEYDCASEKYQEVVSFAADAIWNAINTVDISGVHEGLTTAHGAMRDLHNMSNPVLEDIRDQAQLAFGTPFKITGAGGGGCLVGVVPTENVGSISQRASSLWQGSSVQLLLPAAVPQLDIPAGFPK